MKLSKVIMVLGLALSLNACGPQVQIRDGAPGRDGKDGSNGANGANGSNGHSTVFNTIEASEDQCVNGGSILMIGLDVNDSQSLDSDDSNIQTLVTCNGVNGSNGQDGQDGEDGQDAPNQFAPIVLINPCGDAPGIYDEVLMKLSDGTILASFSANANGQNTRFSVLPNGSYQTTDGDNCVFTLTNGAITYENHHN